MISTRGKAYNMDKKNSPGTIDNSEDASRRSDDEASTIARQQESDDVNERGASGLVSSPHKDASANNKVGNSMDGESIIDQ